MKELWLDEYYANTADDRLASEAEVSRARAREAEERLAREREWATKHPDEWSEWVRISPLLSLSYNFGTGECYDFPQFRKDVGRRPSTGHVIIRRNDSLPYQEGNLTWGAAGHGKSNYLNYKQVEGEFGIKRSALYKLKDLNLVEWTKPPGCSLLFSRASLERLLQKHTTAADAVARQPNAQPPGVKYRSRKTARPLPAYSFEFLK